MDRPRVALSFLFSCCMAGEFARAAPKPPEPPPLEMPKPPPAHVASSEGMPPLPYPVVPQKRQEKKNPPQPPVLLTKIRTSDAEDWARVPHDLSGLLEWMSRELGASFSSNVKGWMEISTDPRANPILYRSGYKPFVLTPEEILKLREYTANGGTVIFNCLVGHPDFYASAQDAARRMLPEAPLYRLRMDHPLFRACHEISKVEYRERAVRDGVVTDPYPWIDGIDLDNRTAIFISRWDIALGWEKNAHESWGYEDADARRLGANLVSYVTAMQEAGRSAARGMEWADAGDAGAGSFRVAWVRHDGPWKTRPLALPALLKQFHEATGAPVSFSARAVDPAGDRLSDHPFLYLTGTTDFTFSEAARANLRQFLLKGGVLFAEASDGRASFDQAFRVMVAEMFPGQALEPLPSDHPLFRSPHDIRKVKPRPALAAIQGSGDDLPPRIEMLSLQGVPAIIYSPHDLSAGWEQAPAPYAIGYEAVPSVQLGVNILFHALAR